MIIVHICFPTGAGELLAIWPRGCSCGGYPGRPRWPWRRGGSSSQRSPTGRPVCLTKYPIAQWSRALTKRSNITYDELQVGPIANRPVGWTTGRVPLANKDCWCFGRNSAKPKRGGAHLAPLQLPNNLSLLHCIQNHFAAYLRPGSLGDLARELSFATISANCFYVWSYLSSPLHAPRLEHLKNSLLLSIYFNLLAQKSLDRDCLRAAKAAADSCLSPPSHRQPEELC
jgi:hypothetical protein